VQVDQTIHLFLVPGGLPSSCSPGNPSLKRFNFQSQKQVVKGEV